MEQLLEKKSEINNSLNDILCILNNIDLKDNSVVDELNNKNKVLHQSNLKLLDEIKEKDKIISMNQKTICDYEKQINSFNEEQEQSNKFDMVKAKDKEVHEKNKIIENLNKEIQYLKDKLELVSDKNISSNIIDTPVKEDLEETPVEQEKEKEEETPVEQEETPVEQEETPVEQEETPVESVEETEGPEEPDSDDQLEVDTITWRKKEYYVLEDDGEKKVFEITKDEDLGKEVGLWIDEKLVRHPKKKK
jgi:hypothetical protein